MRKRPENSGQPENVILRFFRVKFNKDIVMAVVISGLILLCWPFVSSYFGWTPQPQPAAGQVNQPQPQPAVNNVIPANTVEPVANASASSNTAAPQNTMPVTGVTICGATPVVTATTTPAAQTISNENIAIKFSVPELAMIESITMERFENYDRKAKITITSNNDNTVIPWLHPGMLSVNGATPWQVKSLIDHRLGKESNSYTVERLMADSAGQEFKLQQTWTLLPDSYIIKYSIKFSAAATPVNLGKVIVSGGDLQSWPMLSGDKTRYKSHKVDYFTTQDKFISISADDDESEFIDVSRNWMKWVGISNKYFATVLQSETPFVPTFARSILANKEYLVAVGAELGNVSIPANSSVEYNFSYYAGPKIVDNLEAFAPSATNLMHLAWGPIDYLARFMMIILDWLYSICGSYGWSIIIITIIIRVLLFPLTRKANLSMKKMAEIQPQIKAIRDEYKDRPQIMNQKTMELYREKQINPLGGCLPLLLQFPIFIALYSALIGAVQLRQVPFWWSPDLAGPDTVGHIFGVAINPLILVMTLLMVLQQHMTPSAMEPMQKRMMYLMPLVMLFMFYSLPSGLTLYWTVSQICSILQMYIQRKWDNGATPKEKKTA